MNIMRIKNGYVALVTVIVLGSVATLVASTLLLLGLGHTRTALTESQSIQARASADACVEESLRQLRLSSSFTGTGNLILSGSSCSYNVVNTGGSTRQIITSGISGNSTRRNTVDVLSLSPNIVFNKWQEN